MEFLYSLFLLKKDQVELMGKIKKDAGRAQLCHEVINYVIHLGIMGFIRYDQLTFNNIHDKKIKFMDIRPAI